MNSTIGKELTTLRGVLKLASRHEYCEWPEKIMPQNFDTASKPLDRHIANAAALRQLLAAFYDVDGRHDVVINRRAHVLFMVATAIDWTPSTLACREDIDLEAGVVHVRGTKTEHRKRTVPITSLTRPYLEQVLAVVPESGPMFLSWSNPVRDLAVACKRAGIPRVTPRDLRRTLGKWLRAAGVEPQLIALVLGHKDGRQTERTYGRLSTDALRSLLETRLLAVHADVRETVAPGGNPGSSGEDEAAETSEKQCPDTESNRGHGDFQSPTGKDSARKYVRIVDVMHSDGTAMYVPAAATFGEMVDVAVGL